MANDAPSSSPRAERVLAYMVASSLGLSVVAMLVAILGGMNMDGIWPTIRFLPVIGLPLGAVLMIALLVVSGIRKGREAKDARG